MGWKICTECTATQLTFRVEVPADSVIGTDDGRGRRIGGGREGEEERGRKRGGGREGEEERGRKRGGGRIK